MTPETLVSFVLLAVFLLISLLARLFGAGQKDEHQTETGQEPVRSAPRRFEPGAPRRVQGPARQSRRITRSPATPAQPTPTRVSAARRLGLTEPRALRRAVVLMTLLGPCRALDSKP
jgi:hypothetical protein